MLKQQMIFFSYSDFWEIHPNSNLQPCITVYVKMHIVFLLNKVETSNMLVCSLLKPFKYQECGMKEMALKKILQDLMIQIFSCFSDSN